MIAFSGEVTLEDYPSDKPFTEATMNLDEKGRYITTDKKFRQAFHSNQYNILVVANKYQTGFDEPLLHTMYVDKKLRDVTAVQTLSRLNVPIRAKTAPSFSILKTPRRISETHSCPITKQPFWRAAQT